MKIVFPRVVLGNRGDLAARWGLLLALRALGLEDVTVFAASAEDVPETGYRWLPYGPVRNLWPGRKGWRALREADVVAWGVGLDIQDDSSLAKLFYLNIIFGVYRLLGKRIVVLFQGAGPLTTPLGRFLAGRLLRSVDVFVARDPGTLRLVEALYPALDGVLGHDAVFFPGLESESGAPALALSAVERPWIGFNLRQWFHFSSSLLPYQFARSRYLRRSQQKMEDLLSAARRAVEALRQHGSVVLISAYQPHTVPWEDDLRWLRQIKARFPDDEGVVLADWPMSIPQYFGLMSGLDCMVGMRLHSCLIALRFGVPALNISYTLKGRDILHHLGLGESVLSLEDFMRRPEQVGEWAADVLAQRDAQRLKVQHAVAAAIETNMQILREFLRG